MPHLKYLWYVLRHKWFVYQAGRVTGAPLWRLIIHDWSKMSTAEWGPYVHKFYGEGFEMMYGQTLVSYWRFGTNPNVDQEFDRAWLHHQHRNPHHWQHWVLQTDDGPVKEIQMPEALVREMVADWLGAGRAITGSWDAREWFDKNEYRMRLHPTTRSMVVGILNGALRTLAPL